MPFAKRTILCSLSSQRQLDLRIHRLTSRQHGHRIPSQEPCRLYYTYLEVSEARPREDGHSRIKVEVKCIDSSTAMVNNNNRTPSSMTSSPLHVRRNTPEPRRLRFSSDPFMAGQEDTGIAHAIELIEIVQCERSWGALNERPVQVRGGVV